MKFVYCLVYCFKDQFSFVKLRYFSSLEKAFSFLFAFLHSTYKCFSNDRPAFVHAYSLISNYSFSYNYIQTKTAVSLLIHYQTNGVI